ncbi:MAG: PilZ domain-containing protein [Terriglobales bacterium]
MTADGGRPEKERRRSPRFNCGGYVEINWLPSDGIYIPGKVRDLSREGCCIDTNVPIDPSMRAEIVVRVKTNSFRALGEVREVRGGSAAGIEFVRLSAGGKGLLEDLVGELARIQAAIDRLKSGPKIDPDFLQKEMNYRKLQAEMLSTRFPFLATLAGRENPAEGPKPSDSPSTDSSLIEARERIIRIDPVDLFA